MPATYSTTVLGNDGSGSGQDTFGMAIDGGTAVGTVAIISAIQHVTTGTFSLSGGDGGWTTLSGPDDSGTNIRTYVWAKALTAGDIGATITVTSTVTGRFVGRMDLFTGATMTGIVDAVSTDTTADTTIVAPGVSIGSTAFLMFNIYCLRIAGTAAAITSAPAGHTLVGGLVNSAASNPNVSIAASWFDPVSSGTQGGGDATADSSASDVTYTIGIPDSSATQNLDPTSIGSGGALGAPTISTTITTAPTAIATGAALGDPTISGAVSIAPTAIATAEALGAPALSMTVALAPDAITTEAALGEPTITTGSSQLAPESITSLGALGEPTVTFGIAVEVDSITSGESLGEPELTAILTVFTGDIATEELLTAPVVQQQAMYRVFTPPYEIHNHRIEGSLVASLHYGVSVFRIDGEWDSALHPSVAQETGADLFYRGGHKYDLTDEEVTALEAEGYTVDTEYRNE